MFSSVLRTYTDSVALQLKEGLSIVGSLPLLSFTVDLKFDGLTDLHFCLLFPPILLLKLGCSVQVLDFS